MFCFCWMLGERFVFEISFVVTYLHYYIAIQLYISLLFASRFTKIITKYRQETSVFTPLSHAIFNLYSISFTLICSRNSEFSAQICCNISISKFSFRLSESNTSHNFVMALPVLKCSAKYFVYYYCCLFLSFHSFSHTFPSIRHGNKSSECWLVHLLTKFSRSLRTTDILKSVLFVFFFIQKPVHQCNKYFIKANWLTSHGICK